MTKEQAEATDLKARLYSSAASIGVAMRAEAARDEKARADAGTALANAKGAATEATRVVQGFNTPAFRGLADLGPELATSVNDLDSPLAMELARGMAETFSNNFTGATDASKNGGTMAGYAALIRTGQKAPTIHTRLANRLEYWLAKLDSVKDDKTDEGKAMAETARRYTVIPGDSLKADKSWPTKKVGDEDVPKMPKFNGREACVVNGIALPHRGGTDRKAMMAALANLYLAHGDSALHDSVIDAVLDNGGRYKMPADETVHGIASNALAAVEKLVLAGGAASADGAYLQIALGLLARIAKEGFKDSATAPTVPTENVDTTTEDAPAPDSQGTAESEQAEPIALGAATPGKRAKARAKKQGGGL